MTKKTVPTGERLTEFALHVITLEHLHRYAIAIELSKTNQFLILLAVKDTAPTCWPYSLHQ